MKVWLDDLRPAPPGWMWARSAARAIELLSTGEVTEISLDHDLGMDGGGQTAAGVILVRPVENAGSGYDVAAWIEEAAYAGQLLRLAWTVHSANPVGRERIRQAMESAERAWKRPPLCVFGDGLAVAVFHLAGGCVARPDDRLQALCEHHVRRATPHSGMKLVRDLTEGGHFTRWWEGRPRGYPGGGAFRCRTVR